MSKRTVRSVEADYRGRRFLIGLYVVAVFLYWTSLYLYMPTLPLYVQGKTGNLALVGVILAMYGLWQAVVRLPLGIVVDWFGWRKPFVVVGFVLAGLGAVVTGTANDASGLLIGRTITGLAAGVWVVLVVAFSSLFPADEAVRASALLALVASFARMLATGATGWLNELGGYSLAFFLAGGAAALAIVIVLPIRERRRPPQTPSVRGIGQLVLRRDVLYPSLLNAVSQYSNWAVTFGFLPILAKQLGATDIVQSILVAMNIGLVTLGNLTTTAMVRRVGVRPLVYLSFLLMSFGIGELAFASSLFVLFFAQLCMGLAQGIGYPLLMGMSIEHVAEEERTTAMGLHQAVYAIGMFSGPWLSGILADAMGLRPMFLITSLFCSAMGLFGTRKLVQTEKEDKTRKSAPWTHAPHS
jgi:MFS family permease